MTHFLLVIIGMIILSINITIAFSIRWFILHKFKQKKTTENILNLFQILEKLFYFCTVVLSVMISLISYQIGLNLGLTIYILAFIPFIYIVLQLVIGRLFFHRIHKVVRKTENTVKEDVSFYLKMLSTMIVPSILVILFRVYFIQYTGDTNEYLFYVAIILALILFFLIYPNLLKYVLKAQSIESKETAAGVDKFLRDQKMNHIEVYQFSTKRNKTANAMIVGMIKKKLLLSDYLIDHLTTEETCAVIAHELGHLKQKHLIIKILFIAFAMPLFIGLGYLMDEIESVFEVKIAIPVGVVFILGTMAIYFGFVFLKLSKIHEFQADKYALQIGISSIVYIKALKKVAKLNNQIQSVSRITDFFSTHPSLEKRMQNIMKHSY